MTEFKDQYLATDDEITKSRIDMQMNNFSAQFKDIFKRCIANIPRRDILPLGVTEDTSDDAKELELRPKK
ncbi:unnamed protein product [Rhizophagus irregularis]|nr:unnamed protein product [Rhizophagus irregularis]